MDTHHEHHEHDGHAHHGNRVEDRRLITGAGKYASDWNAAGQLYGYFVRSDRAHAEIEALDTAAALKLPDVRAKFLEQGAEPQGQSTAATAAFIKEEEARWRAVIKSANVTLE